MKNLLQTPYSAQKIIAIILFILLSINLSRADESFRKWKENFKRTAIENGISEKIWHEAFDGVDNPDQKVLNKSTYQAEFKMAAWEYFDNIIHEEAINIGRAMKKKWHQWLNIIEKKYEVDRHILLAVWAIETNYGEALKDQTKLHDTIRALATLAYANQKRSNFAYNQLMAALEILQEENAKKHHFTGSWAGAMGHTQFIPSSYQEYSQDIDGCGYSNIWHSIPDALASTANLLQKNGWKKNQRWGYEITIPAHISPENLQEKKMPIHEWKKLGIKRVKRKIFINNQDHAEIKIFGNDQKNPIFLMMNNFYVIKKYNNSDNYALAVGLLAHEIAGKERLYGDWNRPFEKLSFQEKKELQEILTKKGYYAGKIDGKTGKISRAAIKKFQKDHDYEEDGYPSKEVLKLLRKK